jgi:hypothetical protein
MVGHLTRSSKAQIINLINSYQLINIEIKRLRKI